MAGTSAELVGERAIDSFTEDTAILLSRDSLQEPQVKAES